MNFTAQRAARLSNIISLLTSVVMIHVIKQLYLLKRLSKVALLRVLASKVHFLLPSLLLTSVNPLYCTLLIWALPPLPNPSGPPGPKPGEPASAYSSRMSAFDRPAPDRPAFDRLPFNHLAARVSALQPYAASFLSAPSSLAASLPSLASPFSGGSRPRLASSSFTSERP